MIQQTNSLKAAITMYMIPTSPSFPQGPDPCQPCLAPVTLHLGMHLPKTASGPTVLSAPSLQVLPQKAHNSMFLLNRCPIPCFYNKYILLTVQFYTFLAAIKIDPLNSGCKHHMEFWETTGKMDNICMKKSSFCSQFATYKG